MTAPGMLLCTCRLLQRIAFHFNALNMLLQCIAFHFDAVHTALYFNAFYFNALNIPLQCIIFAASMALNCTELCCIQCNSLQLCKEDNCSSLHIVTLHLTI